MIEVRDVSEKQISLEDLAVIFVRNWRTIVFLPLCMAIIVGSWSITQDRLYTANVSFTTQATDAPVGGASALAQQFGIDLGSEASTQSPQFYLDLLNSRAILASAVESKYIVDVENRGKQVTNLMEVFDIESDLHEDERRREAIDELRRRISASVSSETGIVDLSVSSQHPGLAEQIAQQLLQLLNDFNLNLRKSRALEESRFVAERVEDAHSQLLAAEQRLEEFLSQNREFENSPELLFQHDRLRRQVVMRQEIYTSLMRGYEQVQIDAVRDTPLISVIDSPIGSAKPQPRGTIVRTTLALFLGVTIALLLSLLRHFVRRKTAEQKGRSELQDVAREAWHDLRKPNRWFLREKASDHTL